MPHPRVKGAYVSVEGNRRVCALKLLDDPDKAPTEGDRRYFRQLSKKLRPKIQDVDSVIFPERDEARQWLSLRHEGALGGVGIRTWTARQKERFDRRGAGSGSGNPNRQASLLLDYALARGLVTKDEHDAISLTTLTRYLKSPVFRATVGLATSRDVSINVPQVEFDRAARRFLYDAYKNKPDGVHSRTDKLAREAYAHRLQAEGVAPTTRLSSPEQPDPAAPPGAGQKGGPRTGRRSRHPDRRRTVIPNNFIVSNNDPVLRRVYEELRLLDATDFSFAAAYLLRAFMERTCTLFCVQQGLGHDDDLHVLAGRAAERLKGLGVKENQLKPLRLVANERHGRFSPHTLGAYVHGSLIPNSVELVRSWDSIAGNLKEMIDRLK